MEKEVVGALVGAGATVLAAIVAKLPLEKAASFWVRSRNNIPEIMKTRWSAEWLRDDGTLFVKDVVTFSKWTRKAQFEGYGEVTHDGTQYKYSIVGEVSPSRIVVLTYKAERYPTEASFGMACMELSENVKELDGYWAGRTSLLQDGKRVYAVRVGLVRMRAIKALQ